MSADETGRPGGRAGRGTRAKSRATRRRAGARRQTRPGAAKRAARAETRAKRASAEPEAPAPVRTEPAVQPDAPEAPAPEPAVQPQAPEAPAPAQTEPAVQLDASDAAAADEKEEVKGYGLGDVSTVISVEDVTRQVAEIAEEVTVGQLDALVPGEPYLAIENLRCGYGKMEIIHDLDLRVGRKQSLCLIGPNGAGKSTILHAIFGFNDIFSGRILVGNGAERKDITRLSSNRKLREAGIAYILQDKSVFPQMTVEENLWMGGFLMERQSQAKEAAERIFEKYPRLAARRKHQAKVLSGGERRLLEISRALVMEPEVLLVDEPSIGLEPRFIDMVFEILDDLQNVEGKTIIMVEQNAKKGLEFADIGYVLVSGAIAIAGTGDELLANPEVGRLFLGG